MASLARDCARVYPLAADAERGWRDGALTAEGDREEPTMAALGGALDCVRRPPPVGAAFTLTDLDILWKETMAAPEC